MSSPLGSPTLRLKRCLRDLQTYEQVQGGVVLLLSTYERYCGSSHGFFGLSESEAAPWRRGRRRACT